MTVIMRIRHGVRGERQDSDLAAPQVIRDHLDDLASPIDGKPQTSKRAYYRQLRQAGCEINPESTVKDSNRPAYDSSGLKAEIARALKSNGKS